MGYLLFDAFGYYDSRMNGAHSILYGFISCFLIDLYFLKKYKFIVNNVLIIYIWILILSDIIMLIIIRKLLLLTLIIGGWLGGIIFYILNI